MTPKVLIINSYIEWLSVVTCIVDYHLLFSQGFSLTHNKLYYVNGEFFLQEYLVTCEFMWICVTGSPVLNNSVSEVQRKSTVGSLDMGGGSAQIAFEVGKSVSNNIVQQTKAAP